MRTTPVIEWSVPPETDDAPRIPEILYKTLRLAGEPEPFIRYTALDLLAEARSECERAFNGDYTEQYVTSAACALVF